MKKTAILLSMAVIAFLSILVFMTADNDGGSASLASVPSTYDSFTACEKQAILWKHIQGTAHGKFPPFGDLGPLQLLKMAKQQITLKGSHHSDFAPVGWIKYLHSRGSIAKVRITPIGGHYTGAFRGAECALLRLSLTSKVTVFRSFAPGLALKILRDGKDSVNVSALVTIDGQGHNFNFFENPLSNIVPISNGFGPMMMHRIFLKASKYPEELLANEIARSGSDGQTVASAVAPRQIFFVPNPALKLSPDEHDVRDDFARIPEKTRIYRIYAASSKYDDYDYSGYDAAGRELILKDAEPVADIVTTSPFIASEFGDSGIFFRHQLRD